MQEHQNVEWKESWHDVYLEWICCCANLQGSILFAKLSSKPFNPKLVKSSKINFRLEYLGG